MISHAEVATARLSGGASVAASAPNPRTLVPSSHSARSASIASGFDWRLPTTMTACSVGWLVNYQAPGSYATGASR